MRAVRIILCVMLGFLLLVPGCLAEEVISAQWESVDTQSLEDAGAGLELTQDFDFRSAMGDVLERAVSAMDTALREATRSAVLLLLVVLLCESVSVFFPDGEAHAASLVGVLSVAAISVTDVSSLMRMGSETVTKLADFTRLLIPVMAACGAASGSVSASAARQAATLLFCNVLVTVIERVLMPFVYLYAAACVAGAAVANEGLAALAKLFKWGITVTLTTLLTLFTIYLSITNFAAAGADAVTIKLTRTVISGMVPVVGGILSEASETVLAGAAMIRGTVGAFGAATVLACCAGPFMTLCARYLAYRLSAVLASLLSRSPTARLIEEIGSAFALVMGMTGSVALLTMISLFAALSTAVN